MKEAACFQAGKPLGGVIDRLLESECGTKASSLGAFVGTGKTSRERGYNRAIVLRHNEAPQFPLWLVRCACGAESSAGPALCL